MGNASWVRPQTPVNLAGSLSAVVAWSDAVQTLVVEDNHINIAAAGADALALKMTPLSGNWIEVISYRVNAILLGASENITALLFDPNGDVADLYAQKSLATGGNLSKGLEETGRSVEIVIPDGFALGFIADTDLTLNDDLQFYVNGRVHKV